MPTNRELREVASALSQELGVDASTDGLNNEKLTALVASLETTKAERNPPQNPPAPAVQTLRDKAAAKSDASDKEPEKTEEAPVVRDDVVEPKPSRWGYRIRQGFALHCLKGFLRNQAEVNPRDFAPEDFQRHLGVAIVKTKRLPPVEK